MNQVKLWDPEAACPPLGMYSQVAEAAGIVYLSGQVANDRSGGFIGAGDAEAQTRQVFANIGVLLREAGTGWGSVVRLTTYLTSVEHFPAFARVRKELFAEIYPDGRYPAHTLLVVAALSHPDHLVEIDTVAVSGSQRG
jgi:enamine deaminase RidA (YjgF/YER057c/UK114 family)